MSDTLVQRLRAQFGYDRDPILTEAATRIEELERIEKAAREWDDARIEREGYAPRFGASPMSDPSMAAMTARARAANAAIHDALYAQNTASATPAMRKDGLEQTCVGCGRPMSKCDGDPTKSCSFGKYRVG